MKFKFGYFLAAILIVSLSVQFVPARNAVKQTVSSDGAARTARLESLLENLRQKLKIPALSVAVVKNQQVVRAKGFGFADLENKIPATKYTPYHLASLTKTFASIILMQLVQKGKVKLDDPVSKYGITLDESRSVIRVKQLFSLR